MTKKTAMSYAARIRFWTNKRVLVDAMGDGKFRVVIDTSFSHLGVKPTVLESAAVCNDWLRVANGSRASYAVQAARIKEA